MNTNDIALSIMSLIIFVGTVYVFGVAFIDIMKEKFSKKNEIFWKDIEELKKLPNVSKI